MPQPTVIQGLTSDVRAMLDARHADPFRPADSLRDLTFPDVPTDRNVTVNEKVTLSGNTVFLNRPVTIEIAPATKPVTRFGVNGELTELTPGAMTTEFRNFSVGGVKIAEHPTSVVTALGLRADFNLTRGSFPNFSNGMGAVLDAIRGKLVDLGPAKLVTVKQPIAVVFDNGAYALFEPDNGERKLVIDHQFSHPKNALGNQRIIFTVTSQLFAVLAEARTPAFGRMAQIGSWLLRRVPFLNPSSLTFDNVIFADTKTLMNPREKFTIDGVNREALFHEGYDKMGPLAALGGAEGARFVGKVTFKGTNHTKDLTAVKIIEHWLLAA